MSNPERDKYLTEVVLGECWHDCYKMSDDHCTCKKCGFEDLNRGYCIEQQNEKKYDFSTPEGFFKLWNKCKEKEWWKEFRIFLCNKSPHYGQCKTHEHRLIFIPEDFIHPDRFADAVYEFMKERE